MDLSKLMLVHVLLKMSSQQGQQQLESGIPGLAVNLLTILLYILDDDVSHSVSQCPSVLFGGLNCTVLSGDQSPGFHRDCQNDDCREFSVHPTMVLQFCRRICGRDVNEIPYRVNVCACVSI